MQIPSSFFSVAKDTPVFARMLLSNKELKDDSIKVNMDVTFLPSNSLVPWDDAVKTNAAVVVKNCGNTYLVAEPIGYSNDGIVLMFRATWLLTMFVWKPFVALKVADDPESILILQEEVKRSMGVGGRHKNLLRIKAHFVDEESGKLCVVMPFTHGSLRTIMLKKGFSQGFPEDLIRCVLYCLLDALTFLHQQNIFHGDIHAGHIYLCNPGDPLYYDCSGITLGYAATVYEEGEMGKNNSISKWAAAPEVYYDNQPCSKKTDIWLVGITALEFAYGGIRVSNRNALEAMINEIHEKKKLPDKNTVEEDEMVNKLKYYIQKIVPFWSSFPAQTTFTDFVVQCLAWDPKNRPSARTLLDHPLFRKSPKEWYFYDVVMNNNNNKTTRQTGHSYS